MNDKQCRMDYIDIAKGIGIILVILGHRNISWDIKQFIYSFHMPLFFVLSGFLLNIKSTFKSYVVSKKKLIIPFICFSIISAIVGYSLDFLFNRKDKVTSNDICNMFYIKGSVSPNVFLWFLVVLFVACIISYIFIRISNIKKRPAITVGVFTIVTGILGYIFQSNKLPFGIGIAFTATIFVNIGYLIRRYISNRYFKIYELIVGFIVMTSFTIVSGSLLSDKIVDMASAQYGNYILFIISGVSGSIAIICLSYILELICNRYLAILKYWGRNSIVILCTQYFFFLIFVAVDHLIFKIGTDYVNNARAVIDTVIVMVFEIPLIYIIDKWFPFIIGKTRQKEYN